MKHAKRLSPDSGFHPLAAVVICAVAVLVAWRVKAIEPAAQATPGKSATADLPASAPAGLSADTGLFSGLMNPFVYDARGRRDPFSQLIDDKPVEQGADYGPLLPLQRFDLASLRLVGILWDVTKPKAMILDPDGRTHVVGPNAKVGPNNGYVAEIREGEIVVIETTENGGRYVSTAQVVKIAK